MLLRRSPPSLPPGPSPRQRASAFSGGGGPASALPSRRLPLGHPGDCYFSANFVNSPALAAARLPAWRPGAAPHLALSDCLSDDRVPPELSEPSPPPSLSSGRSCLSCHAPPDPPGPAHRPGAVLLTGEPCAPTVGSCGLSGCKLRPTGKESPRGAQRGATRPREPRSSRASAHHHPPPRPSFFSSSPEVEFERRHGGGGRAAPAPLPPHGYALQDRT